MLVAGFPSAAAAAGDGAPAPASPAAAKPDREKKVWTNDDFARPSAASNAGPDTASELNSAPRLTAVPPTAKSAAITASASADEAAWYAQQEASLDSELANIDTQEQQLRDF